MEFEHLVTLSVGLREKWRWLRLVRGLVDLENIGSELRKRITFDKSYLLKCVTICITYNCRWEMFRAFHWTYSNSRLPFKHHLHLISCCLLPYFSDQKQNGFDFTPLSSFRFYLKNLVTYFNRKWPSGPWEHHAIDLCGALPSKPNSLIIVDTTDGSRRKAWTGGYWCVRI